MTRWKITLEYDGTDLCGWQKQPGSPTVQQALIDAIEKFSGENVEVFAAGRTDSGVHARGQVAHFNLAKDFPAVTIADAINFHIRPHKIAVLAAVAVDPKFHARFHAIRRSYRYRIINRRAPLALLADQAWHVMRPLDVAAMQTAADMLIGMHDFSTFRAQNCQAKSPMRTLDTLQVSRDGEDVFIFTRAQSFLYHQVRNMVGTLCMVGNGKWSLDAFSTAFAAKDRSQGGPTAPSCGLCFWDVTYPQD